MRQCVEWQFPSYWNCDDFTRPCPLMRSPLMDMVAMASEPVGGIWISYLPGMLAMMQLAAAARVAASGLAGSRCCTSAFCRRGPERLWRAPAL